MPLKEFFEFTWQVDPSAETVVPSQNREGVHLSDGTGEATGGLTGRMRFSMYTADCPLDPGYLELPDGSARIRGDHVCTVNPGAILVTDEGAVIQMDLKGFGLRLESRVPVWSVNGSLRLYAHDERYEWIHEHLYVFEGEFDESVGRGRYRVYRQYG